jgi:hypothetical protein
MSFRICCTKEGFSFKLITWETAILFSGTSHVLLNGMLGKTVHCRRGVRQGDPLSPLLVVLVADLLQSLINEAYRNNLISLPHHPRVKAYPIVQYAYNTLIIMPAEARQMFFSSVCFILLQSPLASK